MSDEQGQTRVTEVHTETGWSTLWKWIGTIVVVLIIAMVVIYVANTFLAGEQIRADANSAPDDSSQLELNITTDGGDAPATE